MFAGSSFNNSVVVGIAEAGSTVYYNKEKKEEHKSPENTATKEDILQYVMRLEPLVRNEYQPTYKAIWGGILEINEVKSLIYNKGKQQDTTFNRNLVAQIIHQVGGRIYLPTANTVQMSEYLEPQKGASHPVRQKLGESPDKNIKKAVEQFLNEKLVDQRTIP